MYNIEKNEAGYKLTFGDVINADEMKQWVEESKKALAIHPREFGVFVDMRELKPLSSEAQEFMQEGQKLYKEKGMQRSVVILASTVQTLQFKRIAKETGIYEWERYVDSTKVDNWEEVGLAWIQNGTDPDA